MLGLHCIRICMYSKCMLFGMHLYYISMMDLHSSRCIIMVMIVILLINFWGPPFSEASTQPSCPKGFFQLSTMSECHPLLGCSEMASLEIGAFIGSGAVKQVYRTEYKGLSIALVFVNNKAYTEDFLNGLTFLKNLGLLQNIVQLIGYCDSAMVYLTEYHPNGNLKNLSNILASSAMVDLEKLFRLCIDYVYILKVLHDYPKGPVVMCDSSTLDKTLEQYLVTNELRLVLNDLDSLHQVEGDGIVCGHKQLAGDFVAPEQLWPYEDKEYDEFQMPQYCEKVDIWKIPRVCNYILSFSRDRQWLEYHLFKIHKKCRERNPSLRPSATDVLEFYEKVYSDNFSKDNKLAREEL